MAAHALGINKIVSEDALRRTLERIDEASSTAWMRPALMHSVRQALDVQVNSGKQHTSVHAKAALGRLLDELGDGPDSRRPALVRGDSGYGNEGILLELERPKQPASKQVSTSFFKKVSKNGAVALTCLFTVASN